MALQGSGAISFSQLRTEFGATSGSSVSLGAYRISQSVGTLTNLPLDTGIPQSGTISVSNFYSKKLNIVVDLYSGSATTRVNSRSVYDANGVTIIGGFIARPVNSSGKRVIINVNKLIGSDKTSINYAALKTGGWDAGTNLELLIGPSGAIYGAGGDGGTGGDGNGFNGGQGTTALAIQYPVSVNNQGTIFGGIGGGGGGGGGAGYKHANTQKGCGGRQDSVFVAAGGGAGGRGYPGGAGGVRGTNPVSSIAVSSEPTSGTAGDVNNNGNGGAGGNAGPNPSCSVAAQSGGGGAAESSGGGGSDSPTIAYDAGVGGSRGYAIIIDSSGSLISYVGNAAASGSIVNGVSA